MEKKVEKSVFATLNAINVNEHVEKKKTGEKNPDGTEKTLSYLSWVWAWGQVKQLYPDASYEVKHWDGKPYLCDELIGFMVETSVTIQGETMTMWLPVMDNKNKAMKAAPYTYKTKYGEKEVAPATMFDINTAIMRCLVKNLAMFGLGLYIYAGEDLPEEDAKQAKEAATAAAAADLPKAIEEAKACKSRDDINAIWAKWTKKHPEFANQGHEFYNAIVAVGQSIK